MSRTITLLALAQAATIICGFFGLAIMLRRYGYPGEPYQAGSSFVIYHWSHATLFLRRYGLCLLVAPLVWTVFTAIAENRENFIFPFNFWLVIGSLIPFLFVMTFFFAVFHPCVATPN
jgi:hypothetical protein